MKILREYQQDCIESSNEVLKSGTSEQLLVLATGLGKTLTAVKLMQQYSGRKLWLTHREGLISQSALAILKEEEFCSASHLALIEEEDDFIDFMKANKKPGIFSSQEVKDIQGHIGIIKQDLFQIDGNITVASVQTLIRRLDKIPADYFEVLIVDEAHLAASKSFTKCINHFKTKLRLGLTATPHRLDGLSLSDLFSQIIANYDIKYGIDNNFLCKLDAYRIKTELSLNDVHTSGGDFKIGELDKVIDTPQRNKLIVESYEKYAKGRKAIMFCSSVQHAIHLSDIFLQMGYLSSFVVADEELCPNRKERDNKFRNGEIQIMCNVDIYTEGADFPDIGCVGQCRPTQSLTKYLQSLGRGTRIKPDNCSYKDCIILDIVDNTSKHNLINTWSLEGKKPVEERIFISDEKKELLIAKKAAENERKISHSLKEDQKVNLLPLPIITISNSPAMKQEVTGPQRDLLQKLGYDVGNDFFSKRQASELITNHQASDKQKWVLKNKYGYDTDNGCTIGQAKKIFDEITAKEELKKYKHNSPFMDLT